MCHLRTHDYPSCSHGFLKPIFCSRALASATPDRFCKDTRTSQKQVVSFTTHCKQCQMIYHMTVSWQPSRSDTDSASQAGSNADTEQILNNMVARCAAKLQDDEGVAFNCLDANVDRGLGELLTFDAKYMLSSRPKGSKKKNVKVSFSEEEPTVISHNGGAEWETTSVQDSDSVFQIPGNLRFVEATKRAGWAWWRDRKALRRHIDGTDGEDEMTLDALYEYWSRHLEPATNAPNWKLERMLDWINDSEATATGWQNYEGAQIPSVSSAASSEKGSGSSGSSSKTLIANEEVSEWLALSKLREPGMERTEFYSDGITLPPGDKDEVRVFRIKASTGETFEWATMR